MHCLYTTAYSDQSQILIFTPSNDAVWLSSLKMILVTLAMLTQGSSSSQDQ